MDFTKYEQPSELFPPRDLKKGERQQQMKRYRDEVRKRELMFDEDVKKDLGFGILNTADKIIAYAKVHSMSEGYESVYKTIDELLELFPV